MTDAHPQIRSYGRLKTRTIKPRQAALMETLLPALRPPAGPFDPAALMPGATQVWLEIGFGGGEHLAAQAALRPDVLLIGAEPFQNGVASALRHIDEAGLRNVRVHDGDVRELIARMPAASLSRVFILFPDPWPKSRHKKRRLVQTDSVADLARLLRPGGRLRFASDWADYVDWALERFLANPAFRWSADQASDWRRPPADHITTRYEEKRLGPPGHGVIVRRCRFTNWYGRAVAFYNQEDGVVEGCTIEHVHDEAIDLDHFVERFRVVDNDVRDALWSIVLNDASRNLVEKNRIDGCEIGIWSWRYPHTPGPGLNEENIIRGNEIRGVRDTAIRIDKTCVRYVVQDNRVQGKIVVVEPDNTVGPNTELPQDPREEDGPATSGAGGKPR